MFKDFPSVDGLGLISPALQRQLRDLQDDGDGDGDGDGGGEGEGEGGVIKWPGGNGEGGVMKWPGGDGEGEEEQGKEDGEDGEGDAHRGTAMEEGPAEK
jgi:hypothetical protein